MKSRLLVTAALLAAAAILAPAAASAQDKEAKEAKKTQKVQVQVNPDKDVKIERRIIRRAPGGACLADLSDEQKKKVEALNLDFEKAVLPLKAQIEVKRAEVKVLALADAPDKAAIDRKLEEIGALRVQVQKKRVAKELAVRALLTLEQKVAFDKGFLAGEGPMGCGPMGFGGCGLSERPGMDRLMFIGEPGAGARKHIRIMRHAGEGKGVEWEGEGPEEIEVEIEKE